MPIDVIFYGRLRQRFGRDITIDTRVNTIDELLQLLSEKDVSIINEKDHLLISINHQKASLHSPIHDGDRVALFFTPTGG